MQENQRPAPSSCPGNRVPVYFYLPLIVAVGTFLWIGVATWGHYREELQAEQRHTEAEELRGTILYLDELLTMSARMAATTGDSYWERRYKLMEPRLIQAIERARSLFPEAATAMSEVDTANEKLVEMEDRAFELAAAGESQAAKALLDSPVYQAHKTAYAGGLMSFLRDAGNTARSQTAEAQKGFLIALLVSLPLIAVTLITWMIAAGTYRESLTAARSAGKELEKALNNAESEVATRTLEVREKAEMISLLLNSVAEAVYGLDTDGNCTFINAAGLRLLDYDNPSEVVGRNMHELTHHTRTDGTPYPVEECPIYQSITLKRKCHVENEVLWRRDDSSFPVEYWARPMLKDSAPVGAVVTFVDISHRQHMLKEIKRKNKELAQIVYIASHDLRSPLVNIQGFAQELKTSLQEVDEICTGDTVPADVKHKLSIPLHEDVPEALDFILSSVDKMDSLMSGLLRISRLGRAAITIELLDMSDLISRVLADFETQIREAGAVVDLQQPLPDCSGDAVQVNQVFANLVSNALKYRHPDRPPRIEISGRRSEQELRYQIKDNGRGFDPQDREKVFEIYRRLNPHDDVPGDGLGLSVVRTILDRLHGDIEVEAESGVGCTFTVTLPAFNANYTGKGAAD